MWTIEECKFRDCNGVCHCLSRWQKAMGQAEPHPCPFSLGDLSDVCIDFEPEQGWAGGIGWAISQPENVRPKPSPREWAKWAGYDCGE